MAKSQRVTFKQEVNGTRKIVTDKWQLRIKPADVSICCAYEIYQDGYKVYYQEGSTNEITLGIVELTVGCVNRANDFLWEQLDEKTRDEVDSELLRSTEIFTALQECSEKIANSIEGCKMEECIISITKK